MRKCIKVEIKEAICNLNCKYCFLGPVHFEQFKKKSLDTKKTIKNLEVLFNMYVPHECCFRIEALGEILLYPDILRYLEGKARDEGYAVEILSNGTRALSAIDENTSLKWNFSIDGHTAEMNKDRGLSPSQVNKILEAALKFNADIMTTFFKQSIDDMNKFITYLAERNYKGDLHIFPRRYERHGVNVLLDYDSLPKVGFIAGREYFRRWKYIYDNDKRDFTCDFFTNGMVYHVAPDYIKRVKCDCGHFAYEHYNAGEKSYNPAHCGNCINNFEYNNQRGFVNK